LFRNTQPLARKVSIFCWWSFQEWASVVPTIRLRATAGTPSECRSLMSRPDIKGAKAAKTSLS